VGRFVDLTKERLMRSTTFARARGQDVRDLTSRLIPGSSLEKAKPCNRLLAVRGMGLGRVARQLPRSLTDAGLFRLGV
jgi:hypothetical protein